MVEAVALDRSDLRYPTPVDIELRAAGPCADGVADVRRWVADGADDRVVDPPGEDTLDWAQAVEVAGVLVDERQPRLLSVGSGGELGFKRSHVCAEGGVVERGRRLGMRWRAPRPPQR